MKYPNITEFFTVPSEGRVYHSVTDPRFRDMLFDLYCSVRCIFPDDQEVQELKDDILEHCFTIINSILPQLNGPGFFEKTKTMPIEDKFKIFISIFRAWVQFESEKGSAYLIEIASSHNILFRLSKDPNKVFEFVLVPMESSTNTKH